MVDYVLIAQLNIINLDLFQTFDRALCALPITQHCRLWPLYLKFVMSNNIPETAIRVWRRYLKVITNNLYVKKFNMELKVTTNIAILSCK